MANGGAKSSPGGAQKPPEPMCPMCGSPMAKSPIGVAAHRQLEGTLQQMHQAARSTLQRRPGPRR